MIKVEDLSDEELMTRLWDVEEIKKTVYKRGYYIANEWRQKELDELWVRDSAHQATASMGKNTGWYVGMDNIRAYYVTKHQADREKQLADISSADPSVANTPENLHIGCFSNHPATTGLVEIADDGKTAQALFYSIAHETQAEPDGTASAVWVPEKQAYDLVKEDGCWRIWHVVQAVDSELPVGGNFAADEPYVDYSTDPILKEFGTPTVPCLCHDATFNWWDNYPPEPKPYATWSDEISYGPEGYHPPELFAWKGREGGIAK
jgi:hypothetical protein